MPTIGGPSDFARLSIFNAFTAGLTAVASAVSSVPLTVRGLPGQTADLQQWQNSAAATYAYVAANGVLFANQGLGVGGATPSTEAVYLSNGGVPGNKVLSLRASSAQTANIQEWQNASSVPIARVDANGSILTTNAMYAAQGLTLGAASFSGVTYNGFSNPTGITGTTTVVFKAVTGQTASLLEWHSSTGAGLGGVDINGGVYGRKLNISGANGGTIVLEPNGNLQAGLTISIPGLVFSPIQAGAYTNASSRRYKDNIEPTLYEGLTTIAQLQVVDYDYKPDEHISAQHSTGLIAEDTIGPYPFAVISDSEGRPDAIDYSRIVPLLIKAVQELTARLDAQTRSPA